MKKVFVEPEIKKIELNLSENIAQSGTNQGTDEIGFHFWYHWTNCTVQYSNKFITQGVPESELWACYADESTMRMRGGMIVPEETVRRYMR